MSESRSLPSGCKLYMPILDSHGVRLGAVEYWPGKPEGWRFRAEVVIKRSSPDKPGKPYTVVRDAGLYESLQMAAEVVLKYEH